MQRLEVIDEDATLEGIAGVDIVFEDEDVEVEETNVDDIVNLRMRASGSGAIDGPALPVGPWIREHVDDEDLAQASTEGEPQQGEVFPVTAVQEDGRWYVSYAYTWAEVARQGMDDGPAIPAEGITPTGGDSPQDAVDTMLDAVEELDLAAIIAALNPGEFGALQRYAPLFVDDGQQALDEAGVRITVDDPALTESGSGDSRSISIDALRVTVEAEGETATMELADGCWVAETGGETVDSCEQAEDMTALDDVLEDPEPVEDLLAAVQTAMAGYENPGFIVKRHDGEWFVSPLATLTEQLFAVVGALDRDEIEQLQELAGPALESINRGMSTSLDTGSGSSTPDPTEDCYMEGDATAATSCFQELFDAGTIEEIDFPLFLQYAECGLAEISWSGEYYTLPDDEFIALVEETAPCFRGLVESGELEDWELPLEMVRPECLDGRNWYAVTDDDEYFDSLDECTAG